MKFSIFGRNNTAEPQTVTPSALGTGSGDKPSNHERWVGHALFDLQRKVMADLGGMHVESLLGSLAALGGFSCALAAAHEAAFRHAGVVKDLRPGGADGHRYLSADAARRYLIDGSSALLPLPLVTAREDGADMPELRVATLLERIAQSCGTAEFGTPHLPPEHRAAELPLAYVRSGWHRMQDKLDEHGIKADEYPDVFSHALRKAMESIRLALDPTPAAVLIIEYAAPMAHIDPDRILHAPAD